MDFRLSRISFHSINSHQPEIVFHFPFSGVPAGAVIKSRVQERDEDGGIKQLKEQKIKVPSADASEKLNWLLRK